MTIGHEYTQNIVCPHCGRTDKDSWEYELGNDDTGDIECAECGTEFYAVRHIRISYSTYRIKGES